MISSIMYTMFCILCLILFLAIPIILPIGFVVAYRRGRGVLAGILGFVSVLAFLFYARFWYENLPLGDQRVAEFRSNDGAEFVVHQTCNYSIEPYTTRFYYRASESSPWRAFYIDHQDDRWFSGRIDFDEERQDAALFRGKDAVASFDTVTLTFTHGAHTTTNAWILAHGSEPGDEIK